jgi:hypothetical protein
VRRAQRPSDIGVRFPLGIHPDDWGLQDRAVQQWRFHQLARTPVTVQPPGQPPSTRSPTYGVDTVDAVTAVTAATRPKLAEAEIRRPTAAADRTMLRDLAGPETGKRWAEAPITRRRAIREALGRRVVILPTGRRGPGFDPASVEIEWKDQQ